MMLIITTMVFFTHNAMAHFKIGTYTGNSADGSSCSFTIKSLNFPGGLKHPLNEQVEIEISWHNLTRTFSHLAIVNDEDGTVTPKKEILSHVQPNTAGAIAYELHMGQDGPTKLTYLSDNYANRASNHQDACVNLVFQE